MYKFGAIPSPPDVRDYSVKVLPMTLPTEYKQHIGKNYDQEYGTCVAQTLRNIMREAYGIEFGVNFLYGGGRSHTQEGMIPREAAKFLATYGMPPIANDPGEKEVMEVIHYYSANRKALEQKASPYRGATYAKAYNAQEVKSALYSGYGVAACFALSQWDPDSNGIYPCTSASLGYHEMRVFGWKVINGVEYACVQNSWGSAWGKSGECFISWADVFRCNDVLIIKAARKDNDADTEKHDGAIIRRTLRKGMSDGDGYTDISELQAILNAQGFNCGTVDGKFGNRTRCAVKKFQRAHGLEADGIVGPKTWEVIDSL